MKIEKEVMLPATVEEIWGWLNNTDRLQSIWPSKLDSESINDPSNLSLPLKENWIVVDSKPPLLKCFTTGSPDCSIITAFELTPRGKRTSLKVTISGWENLDLKKATFEMPRLSLEWEKRLNLLKQSIQFNAKKT